MAAASAVAAVAARWPPWPPWPPWPNMCMPTNATATRIHAQFCAIHSTMAFSFAESPVARYLSPASFVRLSSRAFTATIRELPDMASAAISGLSSRG